MHIRERRALQDTVTAIRLGVPLAEAGHALFSNGERHLRSRERLARICPPDLLAATVEIAGRCRFDLDSLRYEYPEEIVPPGETPASWLRRLTEEGFRWRFGDSDAIKARRLIEHELRLIAELRYEPYFLTVHDIVKFARSRGILCQGRGSAANSAVCYCLGITEVDPSRMEMLFERFISRERNEPPDIDVDFEHQRREEVLQYIYEKYGRERAALAATVITYRPKSAVRDVGKALGLSLAQVDSLAKSFAWWEGKAVVAERLREAGLDPESPVARRLTALMGEILGFPRHLSQHVGGFVIARGLLSRLVPVENAAMQDRPWRAEQGSRETGCDPGTGEQRAGGKSTGVSRASAGASPQAGPLLRAPARTVIQWDKDDLDALGLLKVDVLALGMLSCIRRALALVSQWQDREFAISDIPAEDPQVYEMVGRGDTVGVFQIESRAQMAMLPRLKPGCFYDLVIEVAIVRPGPIQGGMVHPYLRRRQGLEPVTYPSEAVKQVLSRTLGVPIFQEQVMSLAVVAAGFTPGEADQLRRSMAAWRRKGGLWRFQERLVSGMKARGYPEEFAQRIFQQILGFGEYGFPESHAASFALLVYVSAWLKRHHPAAFAAALLNSQPMGFYAPAQILQDARRHGVEVLPADVAASGWDCTLEENEGGMVKGEPPSPRPRTAEQVPPAEPVDATRERDAARRSSRSLYTPPRSHPLRGHLLLAPARPSPPGTGEREDFSLHPSPFTLHASPALRLGLRMVRGLTQEGGERIAAARAGRAFEDVEDLARRAKLNRHDLQCLAGAGALASLAGHRRQAAWEVAGVEAPPPLLAGAAIREPQPLLPAPGEGENLVDDYRSLGFTLGRHPLALLRPPHGSRARAAGLVTGRQRPDTASGVVFVTLEDETGMVNVVVWRDLVDSQRRELLGSSLMGVSGVVERQGEVVHLVARRLADHSRLLGRLSARSRDFH
jgi:error-prone DNA polymerase